jgi:hypothetical protein
VPNQATYLEVDSIEESLLKDTIYGIEHEELIPIRHIEETTLKQDPEIQELFDPSPINTGVEGWQIILLLITVLLLGMVKAFSNNRYRLGLKALINYSVALEIIREEQVFFHRSNIFLTIAHTLSLSLFIYELKNELLNSINVFQGFNAFLIIVGIVVLVYFVKYIFSKSLLFIFNDTTTASEYIFNISLYNNLLGSLLIPILCIIYFTEISFHHLLFFAVLPLLLLVFLLRIIRLFIIGRSIGLLYVYIFLYICSLEILPLVVLYRFFIR